MTKEKLSDKERQAKRNQASKERWLAQYAYSAQCETCQKWLWEKDREFSVYKFGKPLCAEHSGSTYWKNVALEKKLKPTKL